jgi:hypothetical protein
MHIKKINEFFDTTDLKNINNIDNKTFNIIVKDIKNSDVLNFINLLIYKFPIFDKIGKDNDSDIKKLKNNWYEIWFKNDTYYLSISFIKKTDEDYNLNITYHPLNKLIYQNDFIMTDGKYPKIEKDKFIYQRFYNLKINDIYNIIEDVFIPIAKELKFNIIDKKSHYDINKN